MWANGAVEFALATHAEEALARLAPDAHQPERHRQELQHPCNGTHASPPCLPLLPCPGPGCVTRGQTGGGQGTGVGRLAVFAGSPFTRALRLCQPFFPGRSHVEAGIGGGGGGRRKGHKDPASPCFPQGWEGGVGGRRGGRWRKGRVGGEAEGGGGVARVWQGRAGGEVGSAVSVRERVSLADVDAWGPVAVLTAPIPQLPSSLPRPFRRPPWPHFRGFAAVLFRAPPFSPHPPTPPQVPTPTSRPATFCLSSLIFTRAGPPKTAKAVLAKKGENYMAAIGLLCLDVSMNGNK